MRFARTGWLGRVSLAGFLVAACAVAGGEERATFNPPTTIGFSPDATAAPDDAANRPTGSAPAGPPVAVPSLVPGGPRTTVSRPDPTTDTANTPAAPRKTPTVAEKASPTPATAPVRSPSATARKITQPDVPLEPIPNTQAGGPVAIEAASFNGATPGSTTKQQLQATWGQPKQAGRRGDLEAHLYTVAPFERVEVTFVGDEPKTVGSIVIRLDQPFPAKVVAEQLELARIRPVLISNDLGEILGQAYPERGVLFSFEPVGEAGKTTSRVVQIILEPIGAEPFVLRAETNLDNHPDLCLADLDQALKLAPSDARAHWLRAKALAAMGQPKKAVEASEEAVRLDSSNSHYFVTQAQALAQAGQYDAAVESAKKALEVADRRHHVKARALCLLGDLAGTGPKHDYKAAINYHIEAIKTADPLGVSPHPAIRLAAKEVLVDAHLGAANDIAWGMWKQKETAVPRWLQRASAFADELIANDGGTDEHRLRVATRALAACVGAQGKLDPGEWTKLAVEVGTRLIDGNPDSTRKQQIAWDLGMALYDSLQIYQMRGENDEALRYGELAIQYLEQGGEQRQRTLAYSYLVGRLYFRLGAIQAVGQQDHKAAVARFDRAVPLLSKPVPEQALGDLGRHGETFVSMAVSYWEVGQRDKALDLSRRGVALMQQAVSDGSSDASVLAVPYGNLATMLKAMGQEGQAQRWAEMAAQSKNTRLR